MPITINGVVYRNLEDQVAYLTEGYNDLAPISTYLPTDVSSINKLATNSYVDQAVTTVSAHYLTSNASGDNFATKAALLAGPYYYGGVEHTPDENDYAFVNADEDHGDKPARYVYINDSWMFQYAISGVSGVVDLDSAQTITGVKKFTNGIKILNDNLGIDSLYNADLRIKANTCWFDGIYFAPLRDNQVDFGTQHVRFKDMYLSNKIYLYSGSLYWSFNSDETSAGLQVRVNGAEMYDFYSWGFVASSPRDLGSNDQKWKDLYLSGNIIGSYKEANNVAISSGFASGSFTIDATTLNKAKHIEIYIHGPYAGDYFSMDVPVAAWNLSEFTSATTIKTGNMDYDEVNVIYSNGTLTLAISIGDVSPTPTVEMFLKFI